MFLEVLRSLSEFFFQKKKEFRKRGGFSSSVFFFLLSALSEFFHNAPLPALSFPFSFFSLKLVAMGKKGKGTGSFGE